MGKTQKRIAALLCVCFAVVSLLTVVTFTSHAGHECAGAHCETCLETGRLRELFRHFSAAVFAAGFALAAGYAPAILKAENRPEGTGTLVTLKVQLNH